jgi:hypothetical protein
LLLQRAGLRLVDRVAQTMGVFDRPLCMDELLALARQRSRLSDFGQTSFHEPLERFLASCSSEARLGLVGRTATRWDVVRFLSNLLRFHAEEEANPLILDQPIERPIFITGLPRSGTTFLHRMMMLDPMNRCPLVWETIFPYPHSGGRDQRVRQVARQLRAFKALAPEFGALHPLQATSPQECSEINAHVFRSLRFDTNYHIPSYRLWLDANAERHLPGYQFHKRFLQHMQHQDLRSRRWVLKCPDHVFALEAVRAVYPDARLVFVHRDPMKVLLSVTKLTEVLRRPFTRELNPLLIGRSESARWLDGTRRMIAADNNFRLAEPICHVQHMDLISDPVRAVQTVYRHFGMNLPAIAATSIERYVAERPRGGYSRHHYHFAEHGLVEATEREKFRPYMLHFDTVAEPLPS